MALLSVAECIDKLITAANRTDRQEPCTPLFEALNSISAEDILAPIDVPPSDNSAMDGFAFCHEDLASTTNLPLSQRVQAGDSPPPLAPRTAARIFTGAEIPEHADTVEMQENCTIDNEIVHFNETIQPGKNIRRKGQDIRKGEIVLRKGSLLRAQEIGLLASLGIASLRTFSPLRVAVVNTGNELVEPGKPLSPGKIYNSNRFLLDAILKGWGCSTIHCDIVEDSLEKTRTALSQLAESADLIISTGGVSVGDEDHIKPAVESLGELDIWKVAIKPGKPFVFGRVAETPFIGLPGNPASVFVTALVLARPYLHALQGKNPEHLTPSPSFAKARFSRKAGSRDEYFRARLSDTGIELFPNQSSGILSSACWGNGLAIQKAGQAIIEGEDIAFVSYSELLSTK